MEAFVEVIPSPEKEPMMTRPSARCPSHQCGPWERAGLPVRHGVGFRVASRACGGIFDRRQHHSSADHGATRSAGWEGVVCRTVVHCAMPPEGSTGDFEEVATIAPADSAQVSGV